MLLVVDIGNSEITMGVFQKSSLRFTARASARTDMTSDQYAILLRELLELHDCAVKMVSGASISSVVPSVGEKLKQAVLKLCGFQPLVIGPGVKTGLNIRVDYPSLLGGDLVVGAVAAAALYPLPVVVFDFGTATKISVVDRSRSYLGCAIAAGIQISIDVLAERTITLPSITPGPPKNVIGTNSEESMRSGLIYGAASLVEGMALRVEEELGETASLVLTGGMACHVKPYCRRPVLYHENLLLEGLRLIYEKNLNA